MMMMTVVMVMMQLKAQPVNSVNEDDDDDDSPAYKDNAVTRMIRMIVLLAAKDEFTRLLKFTATTQRSCCMCR